MARTSGSKKMVEKLAKRLADRDVLSQMRGEIDYRHAGGEGSTAYRRDENIEIHLRIPRALGVVSASVTVYDEKMLVSVLGCEIILADTAGETDDYLFTLSPKSLDKGLYFFNIALDSFFGMVYIIKQDGVIAFSDCPTGNVLPQLTVYASEQSDSTIFGGVIYHVFVDRFNRGNRSVIRRDTDVLIDGEWCEIPEYPEYPGASLKNNTFYGGTLWGVIDKLDHIAELGVSAIYLSPIFSSPSNHKYDTSDYMTVDAGFGGEEALCALIREAKEREIAIILDGVFNHTGSDSIYFNKRGSYLTLGAYQSLDSPYYSWYSFDHFPDKYECWWGIDILPRINTANPSCRDYFLADGGVIDHYRRLGIYGWRLDVADELADTFIEGLRAVMSKSGEQVIYGEVWEDASNKIAYGNRRKYYLGDQLDGVMNYPLRTGLIDYLLYGSVSTLRYALCEVMMNAPDATMHLQMNILGSHDTERILTVLGEPTPYSSNSELRKARLSPAQRTRAVSRLIALSTVLYTLPGIPTVYYGDEAGLEGYADPFNRMPYPWGREESRLLSHYKRLGSIRKGEPVFRRGGFKLIALTDKLLVFTRRQDRLVYITVLNNSEKPIVLNFDGECTSLLRHFVSCDFALPAMTAEIFKTSDVTKVSVTV